LRLPDGSKPVDLTRKVFEPDLSLEAQRPFEVEPLADNLNLLKLLVYELLVESVPANWRHCGVPQVGPLRAWAQVSLALHQLVLFDEFEELVPGGRRRE